jgi:hypothetical protein
MTTPLAKLRAKYGEGIGVELFFYFPELQDDYKTYLDTDYASGGSTLPANGTDFSANQYIVIGQPGNNRTEIVQISGTPSSTAIALVAPTVFAHNRGDIIRFIPYNQIVPSYSTDGINFSALSAIAIRPDATETYLQRPSDLSTYVYKFQFYNSTTTLSSAYSDTANATGYADNTIYAVKKRALDQLGEVKGSLITDQFLNDSLQEGRRAVDMMPEVLKWSFRTKFASNIGQLNAGQWQISAPADLRDRNSKKNILSIRVGKQNRPCVFQDINKFNQNYLNIAHTTIQTTAPFGANTLAVLNSADFQYPTGSLTVSGQGLTDQVWILTYTGNNLQGGFTGIAGVPTSGLAVGSDVWQSYPNIASGVPTAYTISAGVISFDVPIGNTYTGQNVKMDYYSIIPPISTDDQTFDEPFYDLYVPFLKYKIKYLKSNGKIDRDGDTDWKDWLDGATKLISQEVPGQTVSFVPDIEGFLSATE